MSSVRVFIEVTSPLAFLPLGDSSVCATAVKRAQEAKCRPAVSLFVSPDLRGAYQELPQKLKTHVELEASQTLFEALRHVQEEFVLVHEALRPLTLPKTFDEVVLALQSGSQAARPAHVVVDTLKTVTREFMVEQTIDREKMQSLTSPEGYVKSNIVGVDSGVWHFQVENPTTIHYVRGDQESIKVRQAEDVVLVESFLAWQTITKS